MNKKPQGFTLIEMCLVMTLLGVLFSAAWPSFQSLHAHFERERLVQDLADCLAFARANAVADRLRYQLRFEQNPSAYQLYKLQPVDASSQDTVFAPAPGRWGNPKHVPEGLLLEAPAAPIDFFPNGSSSTSHIVVKSDDHTTLAIDVAGTLGLAQIHEVL